MELIEYIRSKGLTNVLMFELFDIARRDNVAEGMIDYVAENYSELDGAEDKISELECKLEERDQEIYEIKEELKKAKKLVEEQKADRVESFESFKAFLTAFIKENDRHPSIDETWETMWVSSK